MTINVNFKKIQYVILMLLLAITLLVPSGTAIAATVVTVKIDGSTVSFPDQEPYIDSNDRTIVPMRAPMEAMGCTVSWNGLTKQATITKDDTEVVFTIGKNSYTINGATRAMDTKATITGDRTCIPIRYAAEAFGAKVAWAQSTYTVNISLTATTEDEYIEPDFKVVTGQSETTYMWIWTQNETDFYDTNYKFRVVCDNHPEFNVRTQILPKGYDDVAMDTWDYTVDWFITNYDYAYDPPAETGQVVEYTVYMKDGNNQIIRTWKGSVMLSSEYAVVDDPVLVEGE